MIDSSAAPLRADAPTAIRVCAPGRLHLGFLDPSGSLGRRFGSVGLVIDGFETEVVICARQRRRGRRRHAGRTGRARARGRLPAAAARAHRPPRAAASCACAAPCPRMPASARAPSSRWRSGRAFALWHGLDIATATLASMAGSRPALGRRHCRLRPRRPARRRRARVPTARRRRCCRASRCRGAGASSSCMDERARGLSGADERAGDRRRCRRCRRRRPPTSATRC